jgi:lactaldehyde dehydrogenase/glycolaldehyde dehydrogenase
MIEYEMYVGGAWTRSTDSLPVINPATDEVIAQVPIASESQVEEAFLSASRTQRQWARKSPVERGSILRRWADLIAANRDSLARLVSQEQGKPFREAIGEIEFARICFSYHAEFDRRIEGEILPGEQRDEQLWIVPQPVGVVLAIITWNYPAALAARKIAPALIAGNSIVLKPHEETPLSALELAKLGEQAGLPPGVLNVVTGPASVGNLLLNSGTPRLITFTGGVETGKHIMRRAADHVPVVSLELGGKAPFLVMEDCDLRSAVRAAVSSRFQNCGQACVSTERIYVQERVADEFLSLFKEQVKRLKMGDPLDPGTTLGPKINRKELERVESLLQEAREGGAQVVLGGKRPSGDEFRAGFWIEPTVLTEVNGNMRIMKEEVFGPVVPVIKISDFEEAIQLANDSPYGLAACLFTRDMRRIMEATQKMECGELYVNRGPGESIHGYHSGWKSSGVLGDDGRRGLAHYLRWKAVYLRYGK